MEANGVKRFLIAFLAFLNILFLMLYFYEYRSSEYIGADYVNSAVKNLSERGIAVSSDIFVTHMPENKASSLMKDKNGDDGRRVSDSLVKYTLGNADTRAVELETPDGISITYYDGNEEFSHIQLAKTFYEKNSFYFEYVDNRYANKAQAPEEKYNKFSRDVSYDDRQLLSRVVSCFGSGKSFGSRISGCESYEDGTVFTLIQTLDGTDIFGMYINVLVWNGEILSVKGSWIPVDTDKKYDYAITDSVNAVYSLDLSDVTEIVSENRVYILKRVNENKYYLLPAWEIVYADSEGKLKSEIVESLAEKN